MNKQNATHAHTGRTDREGAAGQSTTPHEVRMHSVPRALDTISAFMGLLPAGCVEI